MTAYQKYQLQWMIDHGKSLDDLMNSMTEHQIDGCEGTVAEIFDDWEFNSNGFGGEIWACVDEWKECEGKETNGYNMNVREYVDCEDNDIKEDWENHIFGNIFACLLSTLPLNPPEVEIDGVSKVREEIWTDGVEILCADEATAEKIANILDAISGEHESHTGYYDPFEDAQNGEVDDHTGFYYVDYD